MSLPAHFSFSISDPDETDLVLVSLHDTRTDFTVRTALPNSGKQIASIMAFAGARYSRSDLSAVELFKEIKQASKSANDKLATIFRAYGHASVADMAQLFAYIENVPKMFDTKFFYETSVGGGQARSSRFQDYSDSKTIPLSHYVQNTDYMQFDGVAEQFEKIQQTALNNYVTYKEKLLTRFGEVYEIDHNDKKQVAALNARVFDSARYFLPNGTAMRTSLCWITSAREWARLISIFKNNSSLELRCLGEQLELLFAPEPEDAEKIKYVPEAPDLIRYTEQDETTTNNLENLATYLEERYELSKIASLQNSASFSPLEAKLLPLNTSSGTKIVAQNILSIFPTVDPRWLLNWLDTLDIEQQQSIGRIVTNGFDHHKQMGNQFRVNTHSFVLTVSICEGLDLNRHRAWGRFIPLMSLESNVQSILKAGYTLPAYLTDNPELDKERIDFEKDLQAYYTQLFALAETVRKLDWFPEQLLLQLLPLGHVMTMWMHASPKEISYMTKLRVRPGGHINYRILAWMIAVEAGLSDPFLVGLDNLDKPDPTSREEFLSRN